jgi:hypothetical protein
MSGSLTGTGLASQVQTYTNTGNGSGTGYYINLGGIKFCWGQSGSYTPTNAGNITASLPTGFFTTVQQGIFTLFNMSATSMVYFPVTASNITFLSAYSNNPGAGTANSNWFVIGT